MGLADLIIRLDDRVAQSLMVALAAIMFQELPNRGSKHLFTEEDHLQETLFLDTPHEPFDVWIWSRRQLHRIATMRVKLFE
jgi:hypothetical protein